WAVKGLQAFADDPQISLVRRGTGLLDECGRGAEAGEWLRIALEKVQIESGRSGSDIRDLCNDLCKIGGPAARDNAVEIIEMKLDRAFFKLQEDWAELLVKFLLDQNMLDKAFLVALKFKLPWHVKRRVAEQLEPAHLSKATQLYVDIVWQLLIEATSSR